MFAAGSTPFSSFEPLNPKLKMSRNERCWCKSGEKWKRCHAVREQKVALPDAALRARFYAEARQTKLCFHPGAPEGCSETISRAHTVQKRSGLSAIADRGHVLSARNSNPAGDAEDLELIGVNEASTFRGFCSTHDSNTFREAEFAKLPNKSAAFLLSYRALCYEIYMKQIAVATLEFARDNVDAGEPFEQQAAIQSSFAMFLHTMRLGYHEHSRLKGAWDKALLTGNLDGFQWSYARFDGVLPVVTSGVFFPERDFRGKALQPLSAPVGTLALLGFNVIPMDGQSCALFGWLDGKRQNAEFIKSFEAVPDSILASAVIQFCFDTSDNTFVNPNWWNCLPVVPKDYLLWNLRNSTPGGKQSDGLVPRLPPLVQMKVLDRKTETTP
jgi:hypothetical protein